MKQWLNHSAKDARWKKQIKDTEAGFKSRAARDFVAAPFRSVYRSCQLRQPTKFADVTQVGLLFAPSEEFIARRGKGQRPHAESGNCGERITEGWRNNPGSNKWQDGCTQEFESVYRIGAE